MRPRCIAVLTILALSKMIVPLHAQQRGPIIDMHLHAGSDDSLRHRVVALMDEFNIVTAFLSDRPDDVLGWSRMIYFAHDHHRDAG